MVCTTYYEVVATTHPWTSDMKQWVGCYLTRNTAQKAAQFVSEINFKEVPCGVDTEVIKCQGKIVHCDEGLRLDEIAQGRICMVATELDRQEYRRLLDLKLRYKEVEELII